MSIFGKYKDAVSISGLHCAACRKQIKKHTAYYSLAKVYMDEASTEDVYHIACLDVINLVLDLVPEEAVTLTMHQG